MPAGMADRLIVQMVLPFACRRGCSGPEAGDGADEEGDAGAAGPGEGGDDDEFVFARGVDGGEGLLGRRRRRR